MNRNLYSIEFSLLMCSLFFKCNNIKNGTETDIDLSATISSSKVIRLP